MPELTRPGAAATRDPLSGTPSGLPAGGSPAPGTGGHRSLLSPGVYAKTVPVNVVGWVRGHPRLGDGLLAAVLLGFSVPQLTFGTAGALARAAFAAVAVVLAATVIPRRRYPVAAFGVAVTIGAAQVACGVQYGAAAPVFSLQPVIADVAILVLLYTLAAYRPRPVSIAALMVCLLGSAVAIARWSPTHGARAGEAVLGVAAALGGVTLAAAGEGLRQPVAHDRGVLGDHDAQPAWHQACPGNSIMMLVGPPRS